jgi:hypothetical protein
VFKLIANDGKADRMIMATKLLNQRIKDVMCARKSAQKSDITPTLVDLERTHILYVNAHFKPFAAIGYEYNKVRPQSGNPTLGGGVTFSIPQFGDFFYDMVCRTRLSTFNGNAGKTPLQSTGSPSAPAVFPTNGTTATGTTATNTFYNIVDMFGNNIVAGTASTPTAAVNYRNFTRYAEFPGNLLFNLVKFDVNGNPLDQYDTMVPTMLEKFTITPNKRDGFNRLVGQEVAMQGYGPVRIATVTDADPNTPAGVIGKQGTGQSNQTVGLFTPATGQSLPNINGLSSTAITALTYLDTPATAQIDVGRLQEKWLNGPQTPKPIQAPLEIWNKLRFWFNDDVRLSIPSVSIPFGQRFISIDLNTQANLTFEVPSIYLETIVDPVSPAAAGGPTAQRTKTYTPIYQLLGQTAINIEKMELYINNIFVNPEIHDIYIKRIGFSLIRVYREQIQNVNSSGTGEVLLSQLKWPVEYMFVGMRPRWNVTPVTVGTGGIVSGGNQSMWRDWHRMTKMVPATTNVPSLSEVPSGVSTSALGSAISSVTPDHYFLPVPTVDTMTLTSHGITIFDSFNDTFFNQYLPFNYGGPSLVTPYDVGALFVNMALFPRSYQPSGHLNISRARETYLKWTSTYMTSTTSIDLQVVAIAINFLLITDGSAVLRYST